MTQTRSSPSKAKTCGADAAIGFPRIEAVRASVVSMPSWELFDDQDKSYRESVFPPEVKARVSVEEASDFGWSKYTGADGHNLWIESFGASAPLKQLLKKFGFTAEKVVAAAKGQIALHQNRS